MRLLLRLPWNCTKPAARKHLFTEQHDLVLMDIRSGNGQLRHPRFKDAKSFQRRRTTIIALTAHAQGRILKMP